MSDDEARAARDAGMASALAQAGLEWRIAVVAKSSSIPKGWEGLYEEVRHFCEEHGVWQPRVPQCWSAMCGAMIKMGMFEHTGEWAYPISRPSHSRPYQKIRRL
jgi:hypothetical protein